jgi:hypothetical protein
MDICKNKNEMCPFPSSSTHGAAHHNHHRPEALVFFYDRYLGIDDR